VLERFGLHFSALLEKDLYLAFGFLQLLTAVRGKLHSLLEQDQGILERYIAALQLLNDLFEPLDALFKFWQGEKNSSP
jgi:hypothetical protein